MSDHRPPTIDPIAAARWDRGHVNKHGHSGNALETAWLHEEVGGRMQDRLQWLKNTPSAWANWGAVRGGLQNQQKITQRYPKSECYWVEVQANTAQAAIKKIAKPWWSIAHWRAPATHVGTPPDTSVQLVWANMLLHMQADPLALISQWQRALTVDGILMFSCLGPDTLRELQAVYDQLGMGPCSHAFTDMHDWGDMLVQAGFAEPVMDMERVTLSFANPQRALQELRGLGRNLHPQRSKSLTRTQLFQLHSAMQAQADKKSPGSAITLTFEVIYGHAYKPRPRIKVSSQSAVSMQDMRAMLNVGKRTKNA